MTSLALNDLLLWLRTNQGYVGILDCSNTTRERRQWILDQCAAEHEVQVVFIESQIRNSGLLQMNYRLKLLNEDYKGRDIIEAVFEFMERVARDERAYEEISDAEDHLRYIKLYDLGAKMILNRCAGYLLSQISTCLNNMHILPRKILLTRHGQSQDNARGVLGGDSDLTTDGQQYAQRLCQWVLHQNFEKLLVWTSCLQRTMQTGDPLRKAGVSIHPTPLLNEIAGGSCDSITEEELKQNHPEIYKARMADKLAYRYPGGGESYLDVIERVKPLCLELERLKTPVLVICHKAVLRVLYAYFTDLDLDVMVNHGVPLHCALQLEPGPYDCKVSVIKLDDFSVDPTTVTPELLTVVSPVRSDSETGRPGALAIGATDGVEGSVTPLHALPG
mmetsp:Transcript_58703/g.138217  ORF Transcript_58703/g.138217 Transcript_58703/m.138217 type:complete len:390 (+) Transcript_58703:381-1550(+)